MFRYNRIDSPTMLTPALSSSAQSPQSSSHPSTNNSTIDEPVHSAPVNGKHSAVNGMGGVSIADTAWLRSTSIRFFPCIAHRSPNIRRTFCSIQPTHFTVCMARAAHLHSIVHIPLLITSLSSLHITTIRLYGYTDDPPFHTSCQTKTGWSLNWKVVGFFAIIGYLPRHGIVIHHCITWITSWMAWRTWGNHSLGYHGQRKQEERHVKDA